MGGGGEAWAVPLRRHRSYGSRTVRRDRLASICTDNNARVTRPTQMYQLDPQACEQRPSLAPRDQRRMHQERGGGYQRHHSVEHQQHIESERRFDPRQASGDHELERQNRKAHHGAADAHLLRARVIRLAPQPDAMVNLRTSSRGLSGSAETEPWSLRLERRSTRLLLAT